MSGFDCCYDLDEDHNTFYDQLNSEQSKKVNLIFSLWLYMSSCMLCFFYGLQNEIQMLCKTDLNMLIPKCLINADSSSLPPTLCSCLLWNASVTGGLTVMTGLCWINVELFISDWVGPPSSKPTPHPVYATLGNTRDEQFLLYIYADQH